MKEKLLLLAAAIIFVGSIIFQNIYWTAVALAQKYFSRMGGKS